MTAIEKIERPVATGPFEEGSSGSPLEAPIVAALREVYDPEIPVNIFDLGLIYVIDISDNGDVFVGMTLTAPGCPVAGEIPIWVRDAIMPVEGVKNVEVEILWDPPWNPDNMSDAAKLDLGMF
ncbi:SUF system Fe-S cluster assembly protein [Sneathiella sp. CAU 1612]|jgi:FeS assembly SUF system protein|uniref:SUF system Fe-S cluster assembly protein n=1 Tax=Sneathiella sedimenti TaxID=2816034 RepID=A0ABS3F8E3_9PROT|nr:SUF system Fe-S cluster assembly protein [Sneathiella sedimenti]MBO0334791.1 SUF system Fe-S cluster assembly protein [Sneathiella sedimenti]